MLRLNDLMEVDDDFFNLSKSDSSIAQDSVIYKDCLTDYVDLLGNNKTRFNSFRVSKHPGVLCN